jgi:hypothetical protein
MRRSDTQDLTNIAACAGRRRLRPCPVCTFVQQMCVGRVPRSQGMTSWRDTASVLAQDDLDGLLSVVVPFAEDMISKHGEFFPFGGSISSHGDASLTAAEPGLGESPSSDRLLAGLYEGALANATTTRAAAFVADVRADGSDAVRVELEHLEGVALVVLLPYTRGVFKKTLTFGQMSVSRGEPKIWGAN